MAESSFTHDIKVSNTEEQSGILFSVDGSRLILASDKGPVRVLGFPDFEEMLSEMRLHTDGVNDVDVSPDGKTVTSTARDKCTFLWDATTGTVVQTLEPLFKQEMRTSIRGARFSPSEAGLLFAVEANARMGGTIVSAWRRTADRKASWQPVSNRQALSEAVCSLAVSPDGRLIAVSSVEGHVALLSWTGRSFRMLWTTETRTSWFAKPKPSHALPVTALRFSHGGNYLFTASADWTVAVWPAYRPWNFKGAFKFLRRLTWFIVLLLAYILGEHKLPPEVGQRRAELIPQLHPVISEFQDTARPIIAERAEHARVLAERNVLPHLEPHIQRFERDAMPILRQQAENARAAKARFETETMPVLRQRAEEARDVIVPYIEQGLEKARAISGKGAPSTDEMDEPLEEPSNMGESDVPPAERDGIEVAPKTDRGVNENVEDVAVVEGNLAPETKSSKSVEHVDEVAPPLPVEDAPALTEDDVVSETKGKTSMEPVDEVAPPLPVDDTPPVAEQKLDAETKDRKSMEPVDVLPVEDPYVLAEEKTATENDDKPSKEPVDEVAPPMPNVSQAEGVGAAREKRSNTETEPKADRVADENVKDAPSMAEEKPVPDGEKDFLEVADEVAPPLPHAVREEASKDSPEERGSVDKVAKSEPVVDESVKDAPAKETKTVVDAEDEKSTEAVDEVAPPASEKDTVPQQDVPLTDTPIDEDMSLEEAEKELERLDMQSKLDRAEADAGDIDQSAGRPGVPAKEQGRVETAPKPDNFLGESVPGTLAQAEESMGPEVIEPLAEDDTLPASEKDGKKSAGRGDATAEVF